MIISNLELVSQGPKLTHTTFSIRTISHRTSSSHHRARHKLIRNISCKLLHTQGMSLFPPPDGYRLKKKKPKRLKRYPQYVFMLPFGLKCHQTQTKAKTIYIRIKKIYISYTMIHIPCHSSI